MPFSKIHYDISSRLLKSKNNRYSRPIVRLSIIGIALGVFIMLLAMAITTGYQREIRQKVIDMGGHIRISNYDFNYSYTPIPITKEDINVENLLKNEEIKAILYFSTKVGIVKTDDQVEGIVLKGVDSLFFKESFSKKIVEGETINYKKDKVSNDIIISKKFSQKMNLQLGEKVRIYFVQEPIKFRSFSIIGIYETGLPEYDNLYGIVDLQQVQKLNDWNAQQVGGAELHIADFNKIGEVAEFVNNEIGYMLKAETIQQIYPQIFEWIQLFDTNVIVLIIITIFVCLITLLSTFFILIIEETRTIGILKALGMKHREITYIFLWMATRIIGVGLIIGNFLAISFAFLQEHFHLIRLDEETYYVPYIPINLSVGAIVFINLLVLALSLLALIIPSMIIAKRITPISAIRFE